jgi:hypothetical protein
MADILTAEQMQQFEKKEQPSYLKQNRWHSFDCTICKVILPSEGAYEMHS